MWSSSALGGSREAEANRAYRKIGVGPEQADAYARVYEEFLRSRNMQIRRLLNSRTGEEVPVLARKRVRRAARKSVKKMAAVLTEHQLVYYEEFLEKANEIYLREAGLR